MKDFIIDANVLVKWVLPEADHVESKSLIDAPVSLRAPDLIVSECVSIFLKRVMRKELTLEQSGKLLARLHDDYIDTRVRLIPARLMTDSALEIAALEKVSAYDSIYLALAVQARCRLVTADHRFLERIHSRELKKHLVSLTDPQLQIEIAETKM